MKEKSLSLLLATQPPALVRKSFTFALLFVRESFPFTFVSVTIQFFIFFVSFHLEIDKLKYQLKLSGGKLIIKLRVT